jgi:hypothetical protein
MTGNSDSAIIDFLNVPRSDVQTLRGEMHMEFKDVKLRLSSTESVTVSMNHD